MKIRSDFVTNSSSTAFILIKYSTLTPEGIRRLMGMDADSPLAPIAGVLCERLEQYGKPIDTEIAGYYDFKGDSEDYIKKNFSEEVAIKVRKAKANGAEVEMGHLASDVDEIEAFLCCESFELENDQFYLNAVSCTW